MKRKITIIITSAVIAGVFLFTGNTVIGRVPKNVKINGIEVGGLSYSVAKQKVRSAIACGMPELKIKSPAGNYVFSYPEILFRDNLGYVLSSVKKNSSASCVVRYYMPALDEVVKDICECGEKDPSSPFVTFDGEFSYFEGSYGIKCDGKKLKSDILKSLDGGFYEVGVETKKIKPDKSMDELKKETRQISSFTTYYDEGNENRAHNIRLAARALNGRRIKSGEEFSFNNTVGKRTESKGYKTAKIISYGEYVYGTGGGVCQVSTTLYNAALLAGLEITEVSAHSLAVGYVEPSFDAMVSSSSDLKFKNNSAYPVYLSAKTGEGFIKITLYGKAGKIKYERKSVVVSTSPIPDEKIVEGDEDRIISDGKNGVVSEGYLVESIDGKEIKSKKIRRDFYGGIPPVREIKKRN